MITKRISQGNDDRFSPLRPPGPERGHQDSREGGPRAYGYHLFPKLGAYWDELSAVVGEIKRRQAAVS